MPPETVAPAKPNLAPEPTIGSKFFDKLTSAPPAPHELQAGATPPAPTPTPAPSGGGQSQQADIDPMVAATGATAPEKKEEPSGLELPKKEPVPEKKEEPKPAAKAPEKPAEPTKDEVDEYIGMTDEEQEAKLSKLSKTDAHKLARKAFARAGKMLQEKDDMGKKVKDLEKAAADVEELKKKVAHLEDGPETKAQQAKIAKAETELKEAQANFAATQEKVQKDMKYVEGLQLAHDVKKTPRWKQYVSEPSEELLADIRMVAASIGEDEGAREQAATAIIHALQQPDEADRWRALKAVGASLDPADQTLLSNIFKGHKVIEKNKGILQGQSDEARKALDEGREREAGEKKAARQKEFTEGSATARENFSKELPWISEDFDISKYPSDFQQTIKDVRDFAKRLESTDLTPAQEAKVKQGFAYFQGASILGKLYSKALEGENEQLRARNTELETAEAARLKALETKETKEEEERAALTPSAAPKKNTVQTKASATPLTGKATPTGTSVGASFAKLISQGVPGA